MAHQARVIAAAARQASLHLAAPSTATRVARAAAQMALPARRSSDPESSRACGAAALATRRYRKSISWLTPWQYWNVPIGSPWSSWLSATK